MLIDFLIRVVVVGADIAEVADTVAVAVFLIRVCNKRAVVFEILFSVTVRVDERGFACISGSVSVTVFLVYVRLIGAVVAFVSDTVIVAVLLAVSGNKEVNFDGQF